METRTTLDDATLQTVQNLLQVNIDSRDGFNDAAEHVQDAAIAGLFRELAEQRNQQASELRSLVRGNDEVAEDDGSIAAATHRKWMDLRAALGGGTQAMLEEAERGEDHIKGKYESSLKDTAGSAVTDVLNRQYAAVKQAHDRVRDLRDAHSNN